MVLEATSLHAAKLVVKFCSKSDLVSSMNAFMVGWDGSVQYSSPSLGSVRGCERECVQVTDYPSESHEGKRGGQLCHVMQNPTSNYVIIHTSQSAPG